ncbi:ribosome biosynthesis protein LTO1 NDAI_0F04130 [Naumovozyma dairenensis CBS 421]|uniref:Essential protein Yae1 N-terminal domain-containing protein n=1 Tax=Naumovozyma dairenensis (strain ATCC 10597 / BCRC 20456 / CBS 421 / NBRC 0211 / NRRL Y-12639) TaxID=1071378 RepID=G0WD70_NAUDC|nr:hypothetical protein NDAI_0F04130 [Naumovozyma dairenensis CBS 421]CCD25731.1 hypothetical protein NDAI_0F04130 [Naumovozyma dairenensis CBS 421]
MDIFDNLLNLEEQFYEEGWDEGHNENLKNNYLEGKQFGLQVGFQRFVLLGQMSGFCDVLESLPFGNNANLLKNIEVIRTLIESVGMNNDEENVENLEKTLMKLKNKFRTILISVNRLMKKMDQTKSTPSPSINFDQFEDLSRVIAGEIKGFVEDEDVTEAKTTQDQAQAW